MCVAAQHVRRQLLSELGMFRPPHCKHAHRQIDYFNKRRILEERQKAYFADTEARINSRK